MKNKRIDLYWWSEIFIQKKDKENYGDLLGKYLVDKISGEEAKWFNPKKKYILRTPKVYATIGSILHLVKSNWIVWGSGIISKEVSVEKAVFLAVRGPQTRNYLQGLGYVVPEVYGDPGLLLSDYYKPKNIEKKYTIGLIPHYNDYEEVLKLYKDDDDVKVINLMTNDIEKTTDEILSCKKVVSSSLHGVIISHTYNIPAVWIKFSDKVFGDGIKYQDYFESVSINSYQPLLALQKMSKVDLDSYIESLPSLPEERVVLKRKKELMAVCPFVK